MSHSNKISIVLTNYNDSRFLINALTAALDQGADEVVFIDDYSTDNSVELVKKISNHIKIVRNTGKKGVFHAIMNNISLIEGEYICFVSADDEFREGHISDIRQAIKKYPMVDLYTTNCVVEREGKTYYRELFKFDSYISPEYALKIMKGGLGKHINMTGSVIKKDVVIKCWEDGGKYMRCNFDAMHHFYCMFSKGFINLARCSYLYRSYPNSMGVSSDIRAREIANEIQLDFLKANLKPDIYNKVVDSGIYAKRGIILTQVILWAMLHIPKWMRLKFYDWCYGYNWRIEKL